MKKPNYPRQIKKLEKDLIVEKYNHEYDLKVWTSTALEYSELADKKDKLATGLFLLGLLLGGLLISLMSLLLMIKW